MTEKKSNGVFVQAGILAAASMIVRIIGLLYRAPLTAIIGDEGNGYYGLAYNIYTIILMVSSYSVPSAISKLMAQKLATGQYKSAQRVFHCALMYGAAVGVIASCILFFGAEHLVPPVAAGVLRVFAPTVFLFGILGALRGYFQATGSMVQTSISQILEQIANAFVSIGAAALLMRLAVNADSTTKAQRGAMGSALGTGSGVFIALVFMSVCYFLYSRKNSHLWKSGEGNGGAALESYASVMKETILVITPFLLSGSILNLTTSVNQTIYTRIMIGIRGMEEIFTTTQYGVFSNKAVVISNIPISIATAVAAAIIPGISAAFAKRDLDDTRRRASNAIRITLIIAIPSAIGLTALAKPITLLMFPQMATLDLASGLLAALSVTVIFYSTSTITNAVLQSIGRMQLPLVSAGIALVIQTIVLQLVLRYSGMGVYSLVLVSILYSVLIFIMNEFFLNRYLSLKTDVTRTYVKPILCALIMGAATRLIYELLLKIMMSITGGRYYFSSLIALIPSLLAAVAVYFYALIRSGAMRTEDIESLPKGTAIARILRKLHWIV
ncbi:MAG: polysaccharide biosynthesis protein [Lachnospiraceae bacterium]|nr:polysaccharide biosynthesis protein [Lachnospiraceae bacterium]